MKEANLFEWAVNDEGHRHAEERIQSLEDLARVALRADNEGVEVLVEGNLGFGISSSPPLYERILKYLTKRGRGRK